MNFIKLYIGDYQRDTGHLSLAEHGAYLTMLQHYYATERPLPTGKALYRLLRAETKAERDAVDRVVATYWIEQDGGLINRRGADEIARADHQRAVNREVGRRGGRPPSRTDSVSDSVSVETDSVSDENRTITLARHQTPDTRHQTTGYVVSSREGGAGDGPQRSRRGSRFALAALPDDWRAFCARARPDLDPQATFDRFADYWRAQPGQRGIRVDWAATWRNWCRNERPQRANGAGRAASAAALAEHNRAVAQQFVATGGIDDAIDAAGP